MVKESVRKCSHCGHNGHNLRTCNGKGCFKLFGVRIVTEEDEIMRKCKSTGDLVNCDTILDSGYLSDGLIESKRSKVVLERKRGVPWSEEEHQSFLLGLQKLGKGDWRGISKNYVPTRTPTQVASHAQKYFIRMAATDKKKRRTSLFDVPRKETAAIPAASPVSQYKATAEISQQFASCTLDLQDSASLVSHLNNTMESQAQDNTSALLALVKPQDAPLGLPIATNYGHPDLHHMPYMVGLSGESLSAAKVFPTFCFVPVLSHSKQGFVYLPSSHENFTTCAAAPYMTQFPGGTLSQSLSHEPSLARPESSVSEKDGLELTIGVV